MPLRYTPRHVPKLLWHHLCVNVIAMIVEAERMLESSAFCLALVIPTKDRGEDLRRMLRSLVAQTRLPDQVIVVDGSRVEVSWCVAEFPELKIDYVRLLPPSLSAQRNAGMAVLRPEITHAGYLDDDVVLELDAVYEMALFWGTADSDIGGAAFNVVNGAGSIPSVIMQRIGVWSVGVGSVAPSGLVCEVGRVNNDIESDWLCGGTVWRREVVDTYSYDNWFQGTGFMEDVDYSYGVRERYRLFVLAAARLAHFTPTVRPDRQFLFGKWQVVNRMYIVRKYRHRGLSLRKAWGVSLILLVANSVRGIFNRQPGLLDRSMGNLAGIVSELRGGSEPIGGFLK